MNSIVAKDFNIKMDEVHVAYVRYHATGERVRIFLAVGNGYVKTERVIKVNVPEYFHVGMEVKPLDSKDVKMAQVTDLLPQAVVKLFKRIRLERQSTFPQCITIFRRNQSYLKVL